MVGGDRGQAHTLEAISAVLIILASIVYALQVTAVTPLTASTSSQHIENQQQSIADGLLKAAHRKGTLKKTLLYWDEGAGKHHGSNVNNLYTTGGPPTEFGASLNETFREQGLAFNLYVYHITSQRINARSQYQIVSSGSPSDNSITASQRLTLYDDDPLYDADGNESPITVRESGSYFASDLNSNSPDRSGVYNVVVVELEVWEL